MRIWKFPLELTDRQELLMPAGAKILDIQVQRGVPQLWALCNPDAEKEMRTIVIYGTGHLVPDEYGKYIATFQVSNGALVFHAFET